MIDPKSFDAIFSLAIVGLVAVAGVSIGAVVIVGYALIRLFLV